MQSMKIDNPILGAMAQGGAIANQSMSIADSMMKGVLSSLNSTSSLLMKYQNMLDEEKHRKFQEGLAKQKMIMQQMQFDQRLAFDREKFDWQKKYQSQLLNAKKGSSAYSGGMRGSKSRNTGGLSFEDTMKVIQQYTGGGLEKPQQQQSQQAQTIEQSQPQQLAEQPQQEILPPFVETSHRDLSIDPQQDLTQVYADEPQQEVVSNENKYKKIVDDFMRQSALNRKNKSMDTPSIAIGLFNALTGSDSNNTLDNVIPKAIDETPQPQQPISEVFSDIGNYYTTDRFQSPISNTIPQDVQQEVQQIDSKINELRKEAEGYALGTGVANKAYKEFFKTKKYEYLDEIKKLEKRKNDIFNKYETITDKTRKDIYSDMQTIASVTGVDEKTSGAIYQALATTVGKENVTENINGVKVLSPESVLTLSKQTGKSPYQMINYTYADIAGSKGADRVVRNILEKSEIPPKPSDWKQVANVVSPNFNYQKYTEKLNGLERIVANNYFSSKSKDLEDYKKNNNLLLETTYDHLYESAGITPPWDEEVRVPKEKMKDILASEIAKEEKATGFSPTKVMMHSLNSLGIGDRGTFLTIGEYDKPSDVLKEVLKDTNLTTQDIKNITDTAIAVVANEVYNTGITKQPQSIVVPIKEKPVSIPYDVAKRYLGLYFITMMKNKGYVND